MSSSNRYQPYDSAGRKGSRWDRQSKNDESPKSPNDEPEKKAPLSFGMGQKSAMKISMKLGGGESNQDSSSAEATAPTAGPIKMSLGGAAKPKEAATSVAKPKNFTIAQAFNSDESSDDEEMPPEAKMRMRNLGKDTPTAAGPNSFGKNRLGFCDRQKVIQREMQRKMDELAKESE